MSKRNVSGASGAKKAKQIEQAATAAATGRAAAGLRLEYRRAGDLTPNPANWRTHPEAQVAALKSTIDEVGYAGGSL